MDDVQSVKLRNKYRLKMTEFPSQLVMSSAYTANFLNSL